MASNKLLILFIFALLLPLISSNCTHPIFCNKTILSAVADSKIYSDSKEFVDLVLKVSIEDAIKIFNERTIQDFISQCFRSGDFILQPVQLSDWSTKPPRLVPIKDKNFQELAMQLNNRWKLLARKVNLNYTDSTTGKCKQNCSSFIEQMNGKTIIIPGGRFKESYYWDSYLIIKGLVACNMLETAENLVRNFILIIQIYGFIPNGFRQYYLNRSQPPFFSMMVKEVADAYRLAGNKDKAQALEQKAFISMITQQKYFMSTHGRDYTLKSGKNIKLNKYDADTTGPRPQAYYQDANLVKNISDENQKAKVLKSLSTMAESGWDFSSRWLKDPENLRSSIISDMIPSDLNSLMGLLESYLSTLAGRYGRIDLFNYYQGTLKDRKDYFTQIFDGQSYPDTYPSGIDTKDRIYPSNYYPFFMFTNKTASLNSLYTKTVNPVSTSVKNGMQWDMPNVWAPNNWILHQVLSPTDAFKIAQEWVLTVYCSWKNQDNIYQKYDSDKLGKRGEGGEYEVQTGFGWTNGLALYYLTLYSDSLKVASCQ